jgi:hypothetical protein
VLLVSMHLLSRLRERNEARVSELFGRADRAQHLRLRNIQCE